MAIERGDELVRDLLSDRIAFAAPLSTTIGEFHASVDYDPPAMSKKIVRDYRSMSDDELRAAAREGRRREEAARYAKGRRSWKAVWQAAEEELARRNRAA